MKRLISKPFDGSFLRFCITGVVGFLVDAGVLMSLVQAGIMGPIAARLISFACAVLVTFELNRRWAFRSAVPRSYLSSLGACLGIQGLGFACNYLVYAGCYFTLRPAATAPLVALATASGVALLINYAGIRVAVFRPAR